MMDRPGFVTGVALVANAVAREIFKVDASPEAIEAVQAGKDIEEAKYHTCLVCGYTHEGDDLERLFFIHI